ncbi:hypothetical protein B0H16DRAFT_1551129 [Mycena metata]|uniref:Prolyl 4-hydroxylase alpha subunit Fe(2+) 2OG dioxygenase domain-containing protein n=1 Tax=Mycena metata TaxID=1033252 RepID=A0AAD7ISQ4_9AGAR|nr:hypothetical protein B0H16DRAFT_1551129 [Mycena metata]
MAHSPANTTIDHHLKVLRDTLNVHVPYTGGIHPVKPEDLVIYYDVQGEKYASRIDMASATEEDLVALASTCDQATFGVDQKDVLDETYRKAGKMDLTKFASRLDVVVSGLIDTISPDILQGQGADGEKTLRAELYKLNVYGPGSFFKGHKDTPRGETMIGSLVVVFPTTHTGGALTLEHGGTTWTFDSAAELAATHAPGVAYVAFYSDVTHAVEEVVTGFRVTLTYNLFLVDNIARTALSNRVMAGPEKVLENSLRALLKDPLFLPKGGFLAWGLAHQYPIPPAPDNYRRSYNKPQLPPTRLGPILQLLKGGDARVRTVSERVGLTTHVKILYDTGENLDEAGVDVLADDVLNTTSINTEYEDLTKEIASMGVVLKRNEERTQELQQQYKKRHGYVQDQRREEGDVGTSTVAVHWVTKVTDTNQVRAEFLAYGNEASIEHIYGNAALFVEVPAAGEGIRA